MTAFIPSTHDVEAMGVVVSDIIELSDSMSPDEAVKFRVALVHQKAEIQRAIDFLDMQLVKTMELPRTSGGWIHTLRRKKEKQRFDHGEIAKHVREAAVLDDDGLMVTAKEAAENAVDMMSDLYVSPSSKVKIGALKVMDIDRREVEEFERGDLYVDVTPVLSEVQE